MEFGRPADGSDDPFLVVENLTVQFPTHDGLVQAVTDLSYTVRSGQTLGIVGESGSGKSVSSMAVLGLHNPQSTRLVRLDPGRRHRGHRRRRGHHARPARQRRRDDLPGPAHGAAPVLLGRQADHRGLRMHNNVSKAEARRRAIEMLDRVGIPQADRRVDDFPHQFSGGMRQRAMIAMALVNDPQLLIADEPTTALDVTVQAQILDLLQDLQREYGSAIVLITHDLGVVAEVADDVLVMYGGRAVESGPTKSILTLPGDALHLGAADQRPRRRRRHRRPADPDPRQRRRACSTRPTGCAFNPRCPHPTRCPATCAGPRCPSSRRRSRAGPPQAVPPRRPRRDLPQGDPARASPRPARSGDRRADRRAARTSRSATTSRQGCRDDASEADEVCRVERRERPRSPAVRPCSRSATWRSTSRSTPPESSAGSWVTCRPSTASRSPCRGVARSAWSASRAAASRRPGG